MWVEARYREREKAEEEAKALAERARAENPDLFRLERLWMPLEEGVALIRGGLLLDVASFFCDCWIVVCEHNKPATDLRIGALGRDIVDNSTGPVFKDFTRSYVQVRVHIAKFYPPSDTDDLEHPGEAALCGLRGDHGDAVCRLMLFLGSTGRRESGTVDKGCSYWFHSAGGFKDKDNLTIGETPSRMVRLPNSPLTDFYDIMMRLDLETGKENAKDFCDKFNENKRCQRDTSFFPS
ncbi:hypothetical protein UCDDA912_g08159 [Diaporthe ampelina]|uniref:Uncharacterized protein n=1 Tax=Diaporthe ampelina TaxID=1214573 RepID=A0A0G2HUZ9_9PEZI|nr:hypothetical protein UCDDA912_g08159 [Diaporthe ampelina]